MCDALCDGSADDKTGCRLDKSLNADEENYEIEGIGCALARCQLLNVVGVIEGEYEEAHEEYGVEQRSRKTAREIAPCIVPVELFKAPEYPARDRADEYACADAEEYCEYGAYAEEHECHYARARDGVIEACQTIHAAEYRSGKRPKKHCADGNRYHRECHVQTGANGYLGKSRKLHQQDYSDE